MKIAKLPPHALALLTSYIHEICQLCGQVIVCAPSSPFLGILNRAPLLCQSCHQSWVKMLPAFMATAKDNRRIPLYTSAYYDAPLKQVMTAFKDNGDVSALMTIYHLLRFMPLPVHLDRLDANEVVLVPTPTSSSRLVERGFYPVLMLAQYLSFLWRIPVWHGIQRLDNTVHQRGLSRSDRLENVKHDFYLVEMPPVRHLIFVDDVVTTGSTLTAMAEAVWRDFPNHHISAVCALHGRADIHLPIYVNNL